MTAATLGSYGFFILDIRAAAASRASQFQSGFRRLHSSGRGKARTVFSHSILTRASCNLAVDSTGLFEPDMLILGVVGLHVGPSDGHARLKLIQFTFLTLLFSALCSGVIFEAVQ